MAFAAALGKISLLAVVVFLFFCLAGFESRTVRDLKSQNYSLHFTYETSFIFSKYIFYYISRYNVCISKYIMKVECLKKLEHLII